MNFSNFAKFFVVKLFFLTSKQLKQQLEEEEVEDVEEEQEVVHQEEEDHEDKIWHREWMYIRKKNTVENLTMSVQILLFVVTTEKRECKIG